MTQTARVKLTSVSLPKLDDVCSEIMGIGKKPGVKALSAFDAGYERFCGGFLFCPHQRSVDGHPFVRGGAPSGKHGCCVCG